MEHGQKPRPDMRLTLAEAERFLKGRSPLADYLFDQFG
jgi:hypothetical protein